MSIPTVTIIGTIRKAKGDNQAIQFGTGKSGKEWCSFRVLASNRVKNEDGSWGYGDSFGRKCVAFGPVAKHILTSVQEKQEVIIIGRERDTRWEDKQGVTHYESEIIVDHIGLSLRWDEFTKTGIQQQQSGFNPNYATPATNGWAAAGQSAQQMGSDPWSNANEPEF